MPYEIRRITLSDLNDVVSVMNGSSRGHSFEFALDVAQFLSLSRLWNFSYAHSYLGFVDGKAAGIVLNSIDRVARQAYSFYWGMLPEYRGHRVSIRLAHAYLDQVQEEGFLQAFADASLDSPHTIYERLGFQPFMKLAELRTMHPRPQAQTREWSVREMTVDELIDAGVYANAAADYWTRTERFIRTAERVLEIVGAFQDTKLNAFAVVTRWPGYTVIWDGRSLEQSNDAGHHLIRHLVQSDYPAPFVACYLTRNSTAWQLFNDAGFDSERTFQAMVLDLTKRHKRHPWAGANSA